MSQRSLLTVLLLAVTLAACAGPAPTLEPTDTPSPTDTPAVAAAAAPTLIYFQASW
jgi:ABC-type uncharacterized transport system auxiliary subunit